jgi:hypothetical protein
MQLNYCGSQINNLWRPVQHFHDSDTYDVI